MAEPVAHAEYLLRADVDAAAASGAVGVENDGVVLAGGLERGADDLRLGADAVAIHAVVAGGAARGVHAQQRSPAQQAIERPYRAYVPAPTARRHQLGRASCRG